MVLMVRLILTFKLELTICIVCAKYFFKIRILSLFRNSHDDRQSYKDFQLLAEQIQG